MALGADAATEPPGPPSVLLLVSLRSSAAQETESAFREALEAGYGGPVDLHVEHLDLPDASVGHHTRALAALLLEKFRGRRFDVVAAQRPEALQFLLDNRQNLLSGVPVVFFDTLRRAVEDLRLPADVTGTYVVLEGQRTVRVALDLHPNARRVVLVGGASPLDRTIEAFFRELVEARAPGIETISLSGMPLDLQLRRLAALPPDSVVFFGYYRADSLGRSMIARDALDLVTRASSAPVYGLSETFLGHGIVGGDMERPAISAAHAARLAVRILRGEAPSSIPPLAESSRQLMFDWRQLKRWGIDDRQLPAGSAVLFREETLWSERKGLILGGAAVLLAQALLIGALLFERRLRLGTEAEMREAERRYRTVADFTHDWEYWRRPDGSFAYMSPSCQRKTGREVAEFESRPSLLDEIVVEEDRPRWKEHGELARAGGLVARLEFRILAADGRVRWMDHACSPVNGPDGTFLGVRGSNRDVTEKRLAEEQLQGALVEIERLRERLEVDNTYLREQVERHPGFDEIIGRSAVLHQALARVQQVAPTSSTVLLQGETGVGKELVAHAIHNLSPRRDRPLVKLNCAALPPSLVESELFGHEKGAFTGAVARRKGRFEVADGSTLFLDEIGELPLELQAKLLRVIQEGELERVGGTTTLKTDVRLVAATNRRLDEEVKAGRFREDLWYRLNVFPITIPPLRQRREDIPQLVEHFVLKHCRKLGRPALQVSQATMQDLLARDWPGNVRELDAVVERTVITSTGEALRLGTEAQPAPISAARPVAQAASEAVGATTLTTLERQHIVATLEQTYWRLEGESGAAALLGMNPSTLRSRMRKHGIRRPGPRPLG
jgi:PAS domain S-box-containing protein